MSESYEFSARDAEFLWAADMSLKKVCRGQATDTETQSPSVTRGWTDRTCCSTMVWEAVPGSPTELNDYRDSLWMVPDLRSFSEGVKVIDFSSQTYSVEILDDDNSLLEVSEDLKDDEDDAGGRASLVPYTTFRWSPNAGDFLLWIRCANPLCNPPEFTIADFWGFREGDRLLITNRES